MGGQHRIRELWRYYYTNTNALIYVVDSTDGNRMEEAREELMAILDADEMRSAVVIIFANKQDMPGAMSASVITDKLGLVQLRNRKWFVQSTCAHSGEGLYEGFDWLTTELNK